MALLSSHELELVFAQLGEPDAVVLRVHNEGPPIAPDDVARLFRPFERGAVDATTARRSVGLGLYIVDQIVRAHGGAIDVSSSAETGTTFAVTLPRA